MTMTRISAVLEAVRKTQVPELSSFNKTVPTKAPRRTSLTGAFEAHDYQIALIPFPTDPDGMIEHLLQHQPLFLVPFTREGLVAQMPCEPDDRMCRYDPDVVTFGEISINFETLEVRRSGFLVKLTPMQLKLLRFFASNPNRVLSRSKLLTDVWGFNNYPSTRTVDNLVLHLRKNLETDAANPVHFKTVHGFGYRFIP